MIISSPVSAYRFASLCAARRSQRIQLISIAINHTAHHVQSFHILAHLLLLPCAQFFDFDFDIENKSVCENCADLVHIAQVEYMNIQPTLVIRHGVTVTPVHILRCNFTPKTLSTYVRVPK